MKLFPLEAATFADTVHESDSETGAEIKVYNRRMTQKDYPKQDMFGTESGAVVVKSKNLIVLVPSERVRSIRLAAEVKLEDVAAENTELKNLQMDVRALMGAPKKGRK